MKNAILVYRTGSLGDGVVTIPALDLYYSSGTPKDTDVIKILLYDTDTVIPGNFQIFDILKYFSLVDIGYRYHGFIDVLKIIHKIKKKYKIQELIYLPPKRTRYQFIRDWVLLNLTLRPQKSSGFNSRVFKKPLGSEAQRLSDALYLDKKISMNFFDQCARVQERLKVHHVDRKGPRRVGFFVSAKCKPSRLPIENLIDIVKKISRNNVKVVLLGEPNECSEVFERVKGNNVEIAGRVGDLDSLFENISSFDEVVTLDSGGAHIAALTGITTYVIAGSREPAALWRPIGRDVRVFRADVHCSECYLSVCPSDNACVKAAAEHYSKFLQIGKG